MIAWMKRYLARDASVSTGPGFEWLADDARWRSAPSFPTRHGAPLVGEGSGTLAINPADAGSGTPVSAAPSASAIDVPITLQIVGGSAVYGPVRTTAALNVAHVRVALPTVAPPAKAKHPRHVSQARSRKRLRARSIDSSASSRGYQPSTLTTFQSGVL